MGKSRALVNKLKRRKKAVNKNKGLRQQDKVDKRDEVLADSPKAMNTMTKILRHLQKSFGQQPLPNEQILDKLHTQTDGERLSDLGPASELGNNWLYFSPGKIQALQIQPGDIISVFKTVEIFEGVELTVAEVDLVNDAVKLEENHPMGTEEYFLVLKIQKGDVKKSYE